MVSMSNDRLRVHVHDIHGHWIVIPIGDIDIESSAALSDALTFCSGDVIVDLSGVPFLDSSGLRVVVHHRKRLEAEGGALHLRAPQDTTRRVFEGVGMSDWLDE